MKNHKHKPRANRLSSIKKIMEEESFKVMPPPPITFKHRQRVLWYKLGELSIKRCCFRELHLPLFQGLVELLYSYELLIAFAMEESIEAADGVRIYPQEVIEQLKETELTLEEIHKSFFLEFKRTELL